MKVKLSDVYISVPVLTKILDLEMPVSFSYKFMKLVNALNNELKDIEEQRVKLVKKYTKDDSNTVLDENKDAFLKEFTSLLETEIDISWDKVPLQTMGNEIKISANDLSKIAYLFSE